MKTMSTTQEALAQALTLALAAPTDDKAQEAAACAEDIASYLTASEVEEAKRAAMEYMGYSKD